MTEKRANESTGDNNNNNSAVATAPDTKKRRVIRACDECRKKKVKCDGQQPCIHCTVYSFKCTYDQPPRRKKVPDNAEKSKVSETILAHLFPDVDFYSADFSLDDFVSRAQYLSQSGVNLVDMLGLKQGANNGTPLPNINRLVKSPSSSSPGMLGQEFRIILPPKHVASHLIESVWNHSCVLYRFYHRPTFIRDLDLLYDTDPEDYTDQQSKILPLVYSVMAVGVLFSMDKCEQLGFKDASEGYKYFVAARRLVDIADAREMYAMQSIVMMVMFLQCSARLSTCYAYIGVALRSALRAGLHRKVAHNFNPVELETRKRMFWTIWKMDIYVNAMLGLPRGIPEDEFDQEIPLDYDDEKITEDGYFPQKENHLSSASIANAHTRLMIILSHVMKYIYPVKGADKDKSVQLGKSMFDKVTLLENEIRDWLRNLPAELKPGANPKPEYYKANRLLHISFCHVQIVLYRPFIHYCSPKFQIPGVNEKAKACARSCINVARTVMYIADELVSNKLLNGAYWYSIYTIFFSVACLVFYVHENPDTLQSEQIRSDAELGKNALMILKDSSISAARTYKLLNSLFEQLNRRTAGMKPIVSEEGPVTRVDTTDFSNVDAGGNQELLDTELFKKKKPVAGLDLGVGGSGGLGGVGVGVGVGGVGGAPDISLGTSPITRAQVQGAGVSPVVGAGVSPATGVSQQSTPVQMNTGVSPAGADIGMGGELGADFVPPLNHAIPVSQLPTNVGFNADSFGAFNGLPLTSEDIPNGPEETYVPGFMDSLETKVFGRFLPPYMLNEGGGCQTNPSEQGSMDFNIPDAPVYSNNNMGNLEDTNWSEFFDDDNLLSGIPNYSQQ
ncbi:YALI0C22990p [Yarrowia lipolytica CLIB122]|jgi:hypothetical protein|uniref:YALI0C22990p n=2 Tax=Yarrowia lipolytica TaxID=4952 RepID=Q6CB01_YARLI|nr:YALI0C22990p [Yarrowia lipolytica CLIB122]AOW03285.1 hypothetical protein YALI1_C31791g [Yarrowia lipolytica]KAB8280291.1 fungal-specific transcription factor domain-containing protein [Yarrowia lipolytica]KAE8170260.1 fungal-specific transcription factor domain-containing protein [Yarrowia lipolytica]KAJ8053768.1 fungal-specific transcription factor domain-containing protein [Yarrowia lipolytica]QNP96061.1 Activator of stress genes 1 [Yarrowia lipolytica]|eukprot:XP_502161.1 YALI0C22990p [Yarrowia lipolytica CLIB122]